MLQGLGLRFHTHHSFPLMVFLVLLCPGSSWCAVSDIIIRLWMVDQLAMLIVCDALIVGNIAPLPASFIIVPPSLFPCLLLQFHSAPSSASVPTPFHVALSWILPSPPPPPLSSPKKKKKKPTIRENKQEHPSWIHLAKKKKKPYNHIFTFISFFHLPRHRPEQSMLPFCLLAICRHLVVMMPNSLINKHLFVFFAKFVCHVCMSSLKVYL